MIRLAVESDVMDFSQIVRLDRHPLGDPDYASACNATLDRDGVLCLEGFLSADALRSVVDEAEEQADKAYFCTQKHSVYLTPNDDLFDRDHPCNRQVISSKGCICDDVVSRTNALRVVYDAPVFRQFVMNVTGEQALHPYADSLSSINVHYANRGQELGWHFDNSEFAITLLLDKPDAGSRFEYIKDLRDAASGDMNYDAVGQLLDGELEPEVLDIEPGTLVLFRGRNSIHRVSPNESDKTRLLAVLAYNSQPGIELSQSARMTFYGRLN